MTTPTIDANYDRMIADFKPDSESLNDTPRRYLLVERSLSDDNVWFSDHPTLEELAAYVAAEHDAALWEVSHVVDLESGAPLAFLVETAIKFPDPDKCTLCGGNGVTLHGDPSDPDGYREHTCGCQPALLPKRGEGGF